MAIKESNGTSGLTPTDYAIWGDADRGFGVAGTSSGRAGVLGECNMPENPVTAGAGVLGIHEQSRGIGVEGQASKGTGVAGLGSIGVSGSGTVGLDGTGVTGLRAAGRDIGVLASNARSTSAALLGTSLFAGEFQGHVWITGILLKALDLFLIDHPLDPANKVLRHACIESPDMKNLYDGVAVLDGRGEAVVELPAWFGALNRDFRYQLTCLGGFAPVYVSQGIEDNRFRIAGGHPGGQVSWQVTGIRQDAWAKANPLIVEEEKPRQERGFFLHPEVHGQPEEKSVFRARHPELQELPPAR